MSAAPHYVTPGRADGWLAVVRGGNALLVQPGAASPEELYDALEGADAVRAVIERLTAGGFAATPDFGLVAGSSTGPRHVVVRGPVIVELPEGTVSGAEVSTWAERVVSASATYRITAPAGAGDAARAETGALPLLDGAVWGSSISNASDTVTADGESGVAVPEPILPADTGLREHGLPPEETVLREDTVFSDDAVSPEGAARPENTEQEEAALPQEVELPEEPAVPEETGIPEETVLPEETVQPDAAPPPPASAAPAEEPAGYDHLFEATIVRPVEAAAVRPAEEDDDAVEPRTPAAPSAEDRDGDHDGLTVLSGDVEGLASRARPAEGEVARPDDRPAYSVVLPDGSREPLDGELLVGRSPSGRVTGERMPRLVTLSGDPDISRTHVRIALEGDTVVVTDMHSRNGTTLRIAGQSPQLLRAGEPAAVIPGSVVDLGGGTLLTIEQDHDRITGPEQTGSPA